MHEQEGGGKGFEDHSVGLGKLGAPITTNHQPKPQEDFYISSWTLPTSQHSDYLVTLTVPQPHDSHSGVALDKAGSHMQLWH